MRTQVTTLFGCFAIVGAEMKLRKPMFCIVVLTALSAAAVRFPEHDVAEELVRMRAELAAARGGAAASVSKADFPDRVPMSLDTTVDHEVIRVLSVPIAGRWIPGGDGKGGLKESVNLKRLPAKPTDAAATELWFGEVDGNVEVFVNGRPVARRDRTSGVFRADISREVKWGAVNEFRVRHDGRNWKPLTVEAVKCGK